MRKLVQSDRAKRLLSNPDTSRDLRKAISIEKNDRDSKTGRSGRIVIRRIG